MSFLIKEGETHPTPPPSFPKCSTFLNNDADNLNGTASLQESSEEDQSGTNGKAKETGDHSTDSDESSSEEEDEETKTEVHGASGSQQYQLNSRAARVGFVSSVIGYLTLLLSQMLLASLAVTLPW